MKNKKQEVFKLLQIDETAKSLNLSINLPKYIPNTSLESFPIPYLKETKEEIIQEETKVYDSKDIFVSPIIGAQKNDKVTGVSDSESLGGYDRFKKDQNNVPIKDKKKIKKDFDLLDSHDYLKILDNSTKNKPQYNSFGSDFINDSETYRDAPIHPLEKIDPIYDYEDIEESLEDTIDDYSSKDNSPKDYYSEDYSFEDYSSEYEYPEEDNDYTYSSVNNQNETLEIDNNDNNEPVIEELVNVPKENSKNITNRPPIVNKVKREKNTKYVRPLLSFLKKNSGAIEADNDWALEKQAIINKVFEEFSFGAKSIGYKIGPTVTLFLIDIEPGTDVNKINNLASTLQMRLKAKSLRIQSPIIGLDCAGIEIANERRTVVLAGNVINNKEFLENENKLVFPMGLSVNGEIVYADIEKMPHGLVAGNTNSGKSVFINVMLISLLYKNTPNELRLILIDPKKVEFSYYTNIPHLATPVITDPKKASPVFKWVCEEMDRRFLLFVEYRVRNIKGYNELMKKNGNKILPRIVVVIDELHDLMLVAGSEIESYIMRLGAKARAAGIHVIMGTQRPSTDVVKGSLKNNIPARFAFTVSSATDSMTIIDHGGAEKLLGRGDMLYKTEFGEERVQGAYIDEEEIIAVTDYISENNVQNLLLDSNELEEKASFLEEDEDDEMFEEVAYFCVRNQTASANQIQKTFKMSFNRADRIVQKMERLGIVSNTVRGKSRDVIVNIDQLNEILDNQ